ncbi:maleylpyruvate isomerase family mycothiol-dependent enzyme [Arthrobacter sp. UM1]|uniref:maleylpyruvate isomerase family mycothiol-dependent enzyme n=1 Tax=Arthrobacter sp. UM1 TaxID=2766776 RepID=UPI001CF60E53|nr:maleylpyruvate isomerase family mycothiol-dependent enzyme [Arthrobacter sp. UM1]MCB4207923.1 maleylpyruvate isomerase family mycothiol-dependent enzyme [Arthrobacter sp. UM1]
MSADKNVLWPRIHDVREGLYNDLYELDEAQWQTRSLCSDWTVEQLVAHMASTSTTTPKSFLANLLKNRFSMDRMFNENIAELTAQGRPAVLEAFRANMHSTTAPPGPVESWLGEALIHAEDIRKPLGAPHEYKMDDLMTLAEFYKGSNLLIGTKSRIKGLKLSATDQAWSTGTGPEVRGRMLPLLMTMTGRDAYLDELEGEGLPELRSRFASAGARHKDEPGR